MQSDLYREDTPIEQHAIGGVQVHVKREDLYGRFPAPPLGKLRGLRPVLERLFASGVRLVGCWDTRVSRLGEGLAAAHREFPGMRVIVGYPVRKGVSTPPSIEHAARLGAEILPLRGNHVGICYAQAKRAVERMGGYMLPFGLDCTEAVSAVARVAAQVPANLAGGTVVLCCGSGVTLSGLILGLPKAPQRLIAISSGRSIRKIESCVHRHVGALPMWLDLRPARIPYDAVPDTSCPFPAHPNYDLKAWDTLEREISRLTSPILFWNIGA